MWKPQTIAAVKEKFVPVSIEIAYSGRRPDVEGRFIREKLKRPSWNGWIAATPNGTILNEEPYLDLVIQRGLDKWNALSEDERKKLDDLGSPDPALDLAPPKDGLVLNVFIRALDRTASGKLVAPIKIDLNNAGAAPIASQAQRDKFWITADEAASLIESERVPAFLADRICRYYLKDSATCIPGTSASRYGGYSGSMRKTVVGNTIQLEGTATGNGPDFRLRGRLEYDPAKKAFTRFDLTAFSEAGHTDKKSGVTSPLGIAFELAPGDRAMDRVPPYFFTVDRWTDPKSMMEAYFKPRK